MAQLNHICQVFGTLVVWLLKTMPCLYGDLAVTGEVLATFMKSNMDLA
jgi:hypothetical protein